MKVYDGLYEPESVCHKHHLLCAYTRCMAYIHTVKIGNNYTPVISIVAFYRKVADLRDVL